MLVYQDIVGKLILLLEIGQLLVQSLLLEAILFPFCSCDNSCTNILRFLFRCWFQCYVNLYNISNSVTEGSVQHKQLYIIRHIIDLIEARLMYKTLPVFEEV